MIDNMRLGLIGELRVMIELLRRGHNPAKSYLDSGVDLVIDNGIKIQVKSVGSPGRDGCFRCNLRRGNEKKPNNYIDLVDFIIVWVDETDDFYIIPSDRASGTSLTLSSFSDGSGSKYYAFKNYWKLLERG